ncbi:hypothetical protein [Nannocystis punicea]|uniref:WD40-like Beta Propeller Repeat n=1 Tax=Nannocystis punicea TaxID=2995304 RepID=A0ABY7GUV4_9BACT|nr:hypothetical protein [Nannocystis poenicansa]WAS90749.1 hypothetical protein O0S08_31565 [Nannocystis poenicansa]
MRKFWAWIVLGCATACPGQTGESTDTAATTEPTTTGSETTHSPTGTTTESTPTTGEATTTSGTTGETGETTGGPAPSGARVVYMTTKPDGKGTDELFFVDCTGAAPGPAIRIHEPLADGWAVASSIGLSQSGRWMHYTLAHPTLGQQVWLVDMSGPLPGTPKQVELPPELSVDVHPWRFSHDDTRLAFHLAEPGGDFQYYLCTIAADGGCVPESWGLPAQRGGTQGFFFEFSPDDTRVAYAGDPDGDGVHQLFLGGAGPGDAGAAVPVSGDAPLDGSDTELGWFSQDGETLYFKFGPEQSLRGVRAVDISGDPPAAPKTVVPIDGRFTVRADDGAVLWQVDPELDGDGDLSLFSLDGAKVGPSVPLHDEPGHVADGGFGWSADGRFVFYRANGDDVKQAFALFAADVSGPTPTPPVRLSAPITTNGTVADVFGGPDPSFAVYSGRPDLETGDQLWMVPFESPADRVQLVQLPPGGSLFTTEIAPDGSQMFFMAAQEFKAPLELFHVDLEDPGPPVKLNAPLEAGEDVRAPSFSQDGGRVFYRAQRTTGDLIETRVLQVDVDAPGQATQVSDPTHDVASAWILPPSGE